MKAIFLTALSALIACSNGIGDRVRQTASDRLNVSKK
jgi:hypothetical protein